MLLTTLKDLQDKLNEVLANQQEAESELTARMNDLEAFLQGGDIVQALQTLELIRAGSRRLADIAD